MLPDTQPLLTHESNLLGVFSKTQLEVPILREGYKSTDLDGAACAHAGIEDASIALVVTGCALTGPHLLATSPLLDTMSLSGR